MLICFPASLLVGAILGFLSGLGVGGGSLLILWLTIVLKMPQETARLINLMFFLPAAWSASFVRIEQGSLRLSVVIPAVISGCIGAFLFIRTGQQMDTDLLKKLFGGLLILTGIRELFRKPKNQ